MKVIQSGFLLALSFVINSAFAASSEQRIEKLEAQVEALTEALESGAIAQDSHLSNLHFGGYGEFQYKNIDNNGVDDIELNFRRFVIFFGYDFNDRTRFISEFEIENALVSAGARGAVELEQAYLEFDLDSTSTLRTGIILMPIGIINETHEPAFFYGVQRPIIATTLIPTTWWSGGVMYSAHGASGLSYDLFLSEGLQTQDPDVVVGGDPFDLKAGKQKTSFASAHDLALTGRIKYTGIPGIELAAYAQYQPDLDQSAVDSYAESAVLVGGHGIFQINSIKLIALFVNWSLEGDAAKAAGKDVQNGGYLEASYRFNPEFGVFTRFSSWSQQDGINKQQTDAGVNYWPYENIVFKFDVQLQNDDAGNADGFNLGMGYHF